MGVDCRIMLPPNVRLDDVQDVIAASVGVELVKTNLSGGKFWAVRQKSVKSEGYGMEALNSCVRLKINHECLDGVADHEVMYHFECDRIPGWRLMMPRSTAFWICVGARLVTFFGGKADYKDCDSTDWDLEVEPKSDEMNHPSDGEPWQNLQKRIFAIKPISKAEWKRFEKHAAY